MLNLSEIDGLTGNAGSVYSDLHKDCYGFRPRGCSFSSVEHFNKEFDYLANEVLPTVMKEEEARKARMVERFEKAVASAQQYCAGYRHIAICWLAKAEDGVYFEENDTYDWGYFEYLMGVPYGYIEKEMK